MHSQPLLMDVVKAQVEMVNCLAGLSQIKLNFVRSCLNKFLKLDLNKKVPHVPFIVLAIQYCYEGSICSHPLLTSHTTLTTSKYLTNHENFMALIVGKHLFM